MDSIKEQYLDIPEEVSNRVNKLHITYLYFFLTKIPFFDNTI